MPYGLINENNKIRIAGSDATCRIDSSVFDLTPTQSLWWCHVHHPPCPARSNPLDLDACPAPTSLRRFCGTTDKLKPAWFWVPNQETVAVILRHKSTNRSHLFWGPNRETVTAGFEAKPLETITIDFKAKSEKTVIMVLRSNLFRHHQFW
jgi:hypothetical protein